MDDFEKLINASDLIEWIMEAYPDWCVGDIRVIVDHIDKMPSAQPEEIIYCGECKHMMSNGRCRQFADESIRPSASDYCSAGERRNDG